MGTGEPEQGDVEARRFVGENRGLSLRDARLLATCGTGATFLDCDFAGAVFEGGRLDDTTFVRVDFRGARLVGVDLRWASLSEVDLTDATLVACRLDGARLGDGIRTSGLRVVGGTGGRVVAALTGDAPRAERAPVSLIALARGPRIWPALACVVVAVAVAALPSAGRHPMDVALSSSASPPGEPGPSSAVMVTPELETLAKEALAAMRAGIEHVRAETGQAPAREELLRLVWEEDPSDRERFVVVGRDGVRPPAALGRDARALLDAAFPEGVPVNPLTRSRAIVPHCNPPSRSTIAGDDADWHYCSQTGEVWACSGFTDVDTLDW